MIHVLVVNMVIPISDPRQGKQQARKEENESDGVIERQLQQLHKWILHAFAVTPRGRATLKRHVFSFSASGIQVRLCVPKCVICFRSHTWPIIHLLQHENVQKVQRLKFYGGRQTPTGGQD